MIKHILQNLLLAILFCLVIENAYSQENNNLILLSTVPNELCPIITGNFVGNERIYMSNINYFNRFFSENSFNCNFDRNCFLLKDSSIISLGTRINLLCNNYSNATDYTELITGAYQKMLRHDGNYKSSLEATLQTGFLTRNKWYYNPKVAIPYYNIITLNYYTFNLGISYSQTVGSNIKYSIGLSIKNINQPYDAIGIKETQKITLERNYNCFFTTDLIITNKFSIKPIALYTINIDKSSIFYSNKINFLFGNTFRFSLARSDKYKIPIIVFCGLYSIPDAYTFTCGAESKNIKFNFQYNDEVIQNNQNYRYFGKFTVALCYIFIKYNSK